MCDNLDHILTSIRFGAQYKITMQLSYMTLCTLISVKTALLSESFFVNICDNKESRLSPLILITPSAELPLAVAIAHIAFDFIVSQQFFC